MSRARDSKKMQTIWRVYDNNIHIVRINVCIFCISSSIYFDTMLVGYVSGICFNTLDVCVATMQMFRVFDFMA